MIRLRGDRGTAALEYPLALGLFIVPIAVLMMMVPQWPEAKTVATGAAKQAASLAANADSRAAGAADAAAAVDQTAANYGRPLSLSWSGDWCRGCTITAHVTVNVPAFEVPFIGTAGSQSWTASSSARVDDFRSIGEPP